MTNKTKRTKEKRGFIFNGPDFSVAMKYSDEAIRNNTIKVIPKDGRPFEIITEDFVNLLAKHVNFSTLAPAYIHNKMINMIQVTRNIQLVTNRDIKAGETINIPFTHMHPIEFAVAEEALGVARISEEVQKLNEKELIEAKKRVDESVEAFAMEQWGTMIKKNSQEPT